jgi:xylan 1,4-beta-xylosidase
VRVAAAPIYSSDPAAIRGTIERVKVILNKYPRFKGVETFLNEWNVALVRPLRDPRFQPCYVAETIYQMKEAGLDFGCYYQIRDYPVVQETFDRFMTPRGSAGMAKWWNRNHQNSGLFDYQSNVRPAYFAFKLLARLTGERLKLDASDPVVHGFATHDQRAGIYNLMLWNFSAKPARVELKLTGLADKWTAKRITLDSQTLNPEENARLHAQDPLPLSPKDDRAPLIALEPYGVSFWMLER